MGETRQPVLVLGQFNLQGALTCARVFGKDVQNQGRAVDHFGFQRFFEVTLLVRRKLIIEYNHIQAHLLDQDSQFLDFAFANVGCRIDGFQVLSSLSEDLHTGRSCQLGQFGQRVQQRPPCPLPSDFHPYQIGLFSLAISRKSIVNDLSSWSYVGSLLTKLA